MSRFGLFAALAGVLTLGACAVPPPTGPAVVGLPPPGKDLSQFQQDDASCRTYASQRIASPAPPGDIYNAQQRYDIAYTQCMYSKGNTVRATGLVVGSNARYPGRRAA